MENSPNRLPAKGDDKIIEVSFSEVATSFLVIAGSAFIIGTSFIIIKDYARYRRQKALLDGALNVIDKITN